MAREASKATWIEEMKEQFRARYLKAKKVFTEDEALRNIDGEPSASAFKRLYGVSWDDARFSHLHMYFDYIDHMIYAVELPSEPGKIIFYCSCYDCNDIREETLENEHDSAKTDPSA